jgi:hypothetical protein
MVVATFRSQQTRAAAKDLIELWAARAANASPKTDVIGGGIKSQATCQKSNDLTLAAVLR